MSQKEHSISLLISARNNLWHFYEVLWFIGIELFRTRDVRLKVENKLFVF